MNIKIGLLSDTHDKHNQIYVDPCDLLLHAGDFTMVGEKREAEKFLKWFGKQPASIKVFIAGNHEVEWDKPERPEWLRELLDPSKLEASGIYYLQDSAVELMGIKIWGCPWQPEFNNWAFNLPRGEKLAEKYALMPLDTDILITHTPPYLVDDNIPPSFLKPGQTDLHVGCKDLRRHILKSRLKLNVYGHIHLDDRDTITPVEVKRPQAETDPQPWMTCINAAVVNNDYQVVTQPYYFNYEL